MTVSVSRAPTARNVNVHFRGAQRTAIRACASGRVDGDRHRHHAAARRVRSNAVEHAAPAAAAGWRCCTRVRRAIVPRRHPSTQFGVGRQSPDGGDPFSGVSRQKAGDAVFDHRRLHADRVGDHRQPGRHVLQHLQPALAAAPVVVRHPTDADVRRRRVAPPPSLGSHGHSSTGKPVESQERSQISAAACPARRGRWRRAVGRMRSSPRSVLDEPTHTSRMRRPRTVLGPRIARRIDARRNDRDRALSPAGLCSLGEEVVAGDDGVARPHGRREAPLTRRARECRGRRTSRGRTRRRRSRRSAGGRCAAAAAAASRATAAAAG